MRCGGPPLGSLPIPSAVRHRAENAAGGPGRHGDPRRGESVDPADVAVLTCHRLPVRDKLPSGATTRRVHRSGNVPTEGYERLACESQTLYDIKVKDRP